MCGFVLGKDFISVWGSFSTLMKSIPLLQSCLLAIDFDFNESEGAGGFSQHDDAYNTLSIVICDRA